MANPRGREAELLPFYKLGNGEVKKVNDSSA